MSTASEESRGPSAGAAVRARGGRNVPVAHVPEHVDVKAIRARLGLSQSRFALRFGFTPAAVRNWEQARRQPDTAARAFLTVIDREPNAVERALAPAAGPTPGAHRERIIALVREHAGEIRARGVARLGLFGSTARGDAGDESDIDIVVEVEPGRRFSLIDLAGLRSLLCEILDRDTDIVIREDLRRRFRARIDEETVWVL